MTNDPIYQRLRDLSWQRKLSGAEEAELRAWLAAHPEAQADWEAEAALTAALDRLPDAPLSSNFTARVVVAACRETAARPQGFGGWPWLRVPWLPRTAFATIVVAAGLVSYVLVQDAHRKKLAESVAVVANVSSLPSPEILRDFDAIRASNPSPLPDEQLLAALK